ncbi:hypothetical protein Tco_0219199 [Tanacetum coccineum]
MAIAQQCMEMDIWEIKEKLVERREQMGIRAYEDDKRLEELNQNIEELKNLIQSFIWNPISPDKTPPVTTMVPRKTIQDSPIYDDLGCLFLHNQYELSTTTKTSYGNKKNTKKESVKILQ